MAKAWKELEKLVRDLEQIIGGDQVEVRSPDRIKDRVTGRVREVDVSVRSKVGTARVLVIIECRKRKHRQDTTWLEQLATKRKKVRAQKAIAVSASPFTQGARLTAQDEDIELRTFDEFEAADIVRWLGGVACNYDLLSLEVTVKQAPEIGLVSGAAVAFGATNIRDLIFIHLADGAEMSIFEMLPMRQTFFSLANTLPLGQRVRFTTEFFSPPGQVGVRTTAGVAEVAKFSINVGIERRLATATSSSYRYVLDDGSVAAYGTQFVLDHFGVDAPIVANFVRQGEGEQQTSLVVRRQDRDTQRILEYDFALIGDDGRTAVATSGTAVIETL